MIRLLFIINIFVLGLIITQGSYDFITLGFIIGSLIIPPIIFNYKNYPERSIYGFYYSDYKTFINKIN